MKRKLAITTLLISFALVLFAAGNIYETMSAPNPASEAINTSLATSSLSIEAVDGEGNAVVSLLDAYKQLETLEVGKVYKQQLRVRNDGRADEFVRVLVRKYWTDGEGNKINNVTIRSNGEEVLTEAIDPANIVLCGMADEWLRNGTESTRETSYYYLDHALKKDEVSAYLFEGVKVDKEVLKHFVEETTVNDDGSTTIKVTYLYDDLKLNLDVEIQSVQASEQAVASVWGVDNLVISGLSLQVKD